METVEILLATYNGEQFIKEQLESILNQDYENWVVRACDDASTDTTYEILLEYAEKYPDKFHVQKNEVGYGSAKLNFMNMIKNSTGQYVMCCDQDDVWLPNKISLTLQEMKKMEEGNLPVLIHTDLKVVDAKLEVISDSFFSYSKLQKLPAYRELLIQNSVTGCTVMINRPLAEMMCRDMDISKVLMHDWVAALLASAFGKIGFVDCPTMLYRQHGVNSVGAKKYGMSLFISKLKNGDIRKSLEDTAVQAGEIAKVYGKEMESENRRLTLEFGEIFCKNKISRLQFYCKHKMLKQGLPRKICQILLG